MALGSNGSTQNMENKRKVTYVFLYVFFRVKDLFKSKSLKTNEFS